MADIVVRGAGVGEDAASSQHPPLRGIEIGGDLVVRAIDELPVLAVSPPRPTAAPWCATRPTARQGDRPHRHRGCRAAQLGADVEEYPDGFAVEGPVELRTAPVWSHGDHRLAMALAVAGLVVSGRC